MTQYPGITGSEPFWMDLAKVLPRQVTRDIAKVGIVMVTMI